MADTPKKIDPNVKFVKTSFAKYVLVLKTKEFIYFAMTDDDGVLMYRKNGKLVSDNYMAENDLFERMIEIANKRETAEYMSPSTKKYLKEYVETEDGDIAGNQFGTGGTMDSSSEMDSPILLGTMGSSMRKGSTIRSNYGERPAIAKERKYTSEQDWEKKYTPFRKSKVSRYKHKQGSSSRAHAPVSSQKKPFVYTIGGL